MAPNESGGVSVSWNNSDVSAMRILVVSVFAFLIIDGGRGGCCEVTKR